MNGKIRVIIGHSQPATRASLRNILEEQDDLEVLAEAVTGTTAAALAREHQPDVLLISPPDLGRDGCRAAVRTARELPATRVVAFSAQEDLNCFLEFVRQGGAGYVPEGAPAGDVVAAIRVVVNGGVFLHPLIRDHLRQRFESASGRGRQDMGAALTAREAELLVLVAEGKSSREISDALGLTVGTVRTYRSRLLRKLDLHTPIDIVRYALNSGLMAR